MPKEQRAGPRRESSPGRGRGLRRRVAGTIRKTRSTTRPRGECVCPSCGATTPHRAEVPCYQHQCPNCGTLMVTR